MTVTLIVISSMLLFGAMLQSTVNTIKNKVDISVYFRTDASESDIAILQKRLADLPEVAEVESLTREEAYNRFRERHKDDNSTLQALDEIGGNPFGASFNIKAKDPSQYEAIVAFMQAQQDVRNGSEPSIIDRVNYTNNKQAIDALSRIINASNTLGSVLIIFFAFVAVLITFNTVRLAIYVFREEISVMRLVGASEMYIRGPFVMVGLMYGIASGILTLLILLPAAYYVGPITLGLGTGFDIWEYYLKNLGYIAGIVLGAGIILGAVSSFLAVRKYLRA